MKRAQTKFIFKFLARRQVIFIAVAAQISVFSSAHVPARDQDYLDTINAEAEDLGEVGNTDINQPITTSGDNAIGESVSTPAASEKPDSFLQKINSTLYSGSIDAEASESAYIKQLEAEVEHLNKSTPQSASVADEASTQSTQDHLKLEKETVIQITEAQRKEMETALELKIPGIYRLYNKLGLTQKRLVVKEYLTNEKISTASKTILKLYSGKDPF